jgi:phytoene dehydrogenase-like protein
LARQGVYHVEGGIGGVAKVLVEKIRELGGHVIYKQLVRRIMVKDKRAVGVETTHGRRGKTVEFFPCDFVIGNLTPWTLDSLLGEDSPHGLRREAQTRTAGWGAFALHMGLDAAKLPVDLSDHHQIIADTESPLGEGNSIFVSLSPTWDKTRAPQGFRAATLTTHTNVALWWDLINTDENAYHARKAEYAERMLAAVDNAIPNFRSAVALELTGSPVTYQFYTGRHLGMVGGFPQTSLFKARSPRTGISNVRLVGDSIFPGQSTAGVTLGAIRVSEDVMRQLLESNQRKFIIQTKQAHGCTPLQEPHVRLELD